MRASGGVGGGRRGRVDASTGASGGGTGGPALLRVIRPVVGSRWIPHSLAVSSSHHHRPARACSPASGRAGAGRAADAGVAAVVQLVVGHPVVTDVGPHLLARPLQHRVELLQPVPLVPRGDLQITAGGRLLAAQPGQPGAVAGESTPQRRDLADAAALVAAFDGVVEAVLAVLGRPRGDLLGIGADHPDHRAVALVDAVGERVGVLGQPAGVDAEDVDPEAVLRDQVGHDHALGAERVGEDRGRVIGGDGPQEGERRGQRIVVAHPYDSSGGDSHALAAMLTPRQPAGRRPHGGPARAPAAPVRTSAYGGTPRARRTLRMGRRRAARRGGCHERTGSPGDGGGTRGPGGDGGGDDRGRRRRDERGRRLGQAGAGGAGGRHLAAPPARGPAAVLGDARGPGGPAGQLPDLPRPDGPARPGARHLAGSLPRSRAVSTATAWPSTSPARRQYLAYARAGLEWTDGAVRARPTRRLAPTTSSTPEAARNPTGNKELFDLASVGMAYGMYFNVTREQWAEDGLLAVRDLIFTSYRNPGQRGVLRCVDVRHAVTGGPWREQRPGHHQPARPRVRRAAAVRRRAQ